VKKRENMFKVFNTTSKLNRAFLKEKKALMYMNFANGLMLRDIKSEKRSQVDRL